MARAASSSGNSGGILSDSAEAQALLAGLQSASERLRAVLPPAQAKLLPKRNPIKLDEGVKKALAGSKKQKLRESGSPSPSDVAIRFADGLFALLQDYVQVARWVTVGASSSPIASSEEPPAAKKQKKAAAAATTTTSKSSEDAADEKESSSAAALAAAKAGKFSVIPVTPAAKSKAAKNDVAKESEENADKKRKADASGASTDGEEDGAEGDGECNFE